MMEISQEFDQTYNQDEYERKIGQIIRRIHDQPDNNRDDDRWKEAVQRLRDEDHYLLVLINGASSTSVRFSRWGNVRLFLAGAGLWRCSFPYSLSSSLTYPIRRFPN
jgi:hypothetical protein